MVLVHGVGLRLEAKMPQIRAFASREAVCVRAAAIDVWLAEPVVAPKVRSA